MKAFRMQRAKRLLLTAGGLLAVAACAIGGAVVALHATGDRVYDTEVGDIRIGVRAAVDGRMELYVPIVDWRLRAEPFAAPVVISVEAVSVDRRAAARAAANPRAAPELIARSTEDGRVALRRATRRGAIAASIGLLMGAVVGGALVAATKLRRRWLVVGALEGLVLIGICIAPSVMSVSNFDERSLASPQLAGNANELPHLIAFAQQLLVVGDDYQAHYERALRSVSNAATFAATDPGSHRRGETSLVVASDLHNNLFVLRSLVGFAEDDVVVFAGDFGQLGTTSEAGMADEIAGAGRRVIAVSGNHDSSTFMHGLSTAGVEVLTRAGKLGATPGDTPFLSNEGLEIAGYDDPLEGRDGEAHALRVDTETYEEHVRDFIEWFDGLPHVPDVVVVHQHGLGERLLRHIATSDLDRAVVIVAGHDHRAHVDKLSMHVLVDPGTLGAGGPFAVGEQDASFARIRFREGRPYAVDIAAIEPLSGRALAQRVVLDGPHATMRTVRVSTFTDT